MSDLLNKNILQKQQETTAQINALLAKSAEALSCGPDCQKLKTTQELEQKYLDSQTNMQTAPIQLEEARKNYYVYSKGDSAYNTMLEDDLTKKADAIGDEITSRFYLEVKKANVLNAYYNSDLINSKNTFELYNTYFKDNKNAENIIRNARGDILTNDRKSFYETQEYDALDWWHTLFISIYYILVVVFVLGLLFSSNQMSIFKKIGLLVVFLIYPFIIDYVFTFVMKIINDIKQLFPKNIYRTN